MNNNNYNNMNNRVHSNNPNNPMGQPPYPQNGAPVQRPVQQNMPPEQKGKKPKKSIAGKIIAVIIVLILLVFAVIGGAAAAILIIKLLPEKTDKTEATTNYAYEETTAEDSSVTLIINGNFSGEIVKPEIFSARTLYGEVLASSNTNAARSFDADNAIDGIADTCWCVNTENEGGAGASIRIDLYRKSTLSGLKIINGNLYRPEEDIYLSNGQLSTFTVTYSDGTSDSFSIPFNNSASREYTTIYFGEAKETEYIILTVDSAYVGAKYTTNVCIGEIDVF